MADVTVYTTPTCPWCTRAKAWLSQRGVPYVEKDVSHDQQAAQEMVQRTGQMGVPVITVNGDVIVGFDQPRLERLFPASGASRKRLGASVASAPGGLRVGRVHPGSLAARADLRSGDLILRLNGDPVATPEQLQDHLAGPLQRGHPVTLRVQRDGKDLELRLAPPYD
jgi:glutaredoxin-like YruB-family protein